MENMIALIDMDNTLADYNSALIRDMKSLRAPSEDVKDFNDVNSKTISWSADYNLHNPELAYMKARVKFIRNVPGWWVNLEPLKAGFDIVSQSIVIITIYKINGHSISETN